jgi:hypothetical protein
MNEKSTDISTDMAVVKQEHAWRVGWKAEGRKA